VKSARNIYQSFKQLEEVLHKNELLQIPPHQGIIHSFREHCLRRPEPLPKFPIESEVSCHPVGQNGMNAERNQQVTKS
jgi:hypothetical protein